MIFAGTHNEAFVHQTKMRDAVRWDDLDARVAKVASAQRSFRCGYPPRGVVVSGPARLALCDAFVRSEVSGRTVFWSVAATTSSLGKLAGYLCRVNDCAGNWL